MLMKREVNFRTDILQEKIDQDLAIGIVDTIEIEVGTNTTNTTKRAVIAEEDLTLHLTHQIRPEVAIEGTEAMRGIAKIEGKSHVEIIEEMKGRKMVEEVRNRPLGITKTLITIVVKRRLKSL